MFSALAASTSWATTFLAVRRFGDLVVGVLRVEHAEAVVVLGREDHVLLDPPLWRGGQMALYLDYMELSVFANLLTAMAIRLSSGSTDSACKQK